MCWLPSWHCCGNNKGDMGFVINCTAVGVSDGYQHILLCFWEVFGNPFYLLCSWVATRLPHDSAQYLMVTLDAFRNATPLRYQEQWICLWTSGHLMLLPALLLVMGIMILCFAISLVIAICVQQPAPSVMKMSA